MAEMFGNSFIIVEVTAKDTEATQIWIARAKPSQAGSLVLAELPEGWKAELLANYRKRNKRRLKN